MNKTKKCIYTYKKTNTILYTSINHVSRRGLVICRHYYRRLTCYLNKQWISVWHIKTILLFGHHFIYSKPLTLRIMI